MRHLPNDPTARPVGFRPATAAPLALLGVLACAPPSTVGGFAVAVDDGALTIEGSRGQPLVAGL
ncbi:MAG: hypothetical protein ACK4YP_18770, partial [Myxococcota bacterium]